MFAISFSRGLISISIDQIKTEQIDDKKKLSINKIALLTIILLRIFICDSLSMVSIRNKYQQK